MKEKRVFMVTKIMKEDIIEIIRNKTINWDFLRDTTVLITGPTGMIGQYLALTLFTIQKKYNIKIIMLVRNRKKAELIFEEYLDSNTRIIVTDFKSFPDIEGDISYILHAASLAAPNYYETVPVDVIEPNVIGTYELLKLGVEKKIKNFLFFSSSEIYGKINNCSHYSEKELGIVDCAEVRNCYAESKRMGENLCCSFTRQYNLPTNIVRIFHTYGPSMDIKNDRRAFSEFVKNAVDNEKIIIKGDGKAKRPFCYITDAVVAFFLILLNGDGQGEVYNMSNINNYVSIKELANTIANLQINKNVKVEIGSRQSSDTYSIKKDENYVTGSSEKLYQLGWNPSVTISKGFERTIMSKIEERKLIRLETINKKGEELNDN